MVNAQFRQATNVAPGERVPSALAGAALMAYGLTRRNLGGIVLALAGGEMIYRGATAHCPVYAALGVNRAHREGNPNATVRHHQGIQIRKSVVIEKPVAELFNFWRDFENLPKFMRHLQSVQILDDKRSHWVVRAPGGRTVEWDAVIINEQPNELIAWKSLGNADIPNAGSVLFERMQGDTATVVTVELDYAPPAGPLGALFAKALGQDPAAAVEEDLQRFKELMEADQIASGQVSIFCVVSSEEKDAVQEASEESFPASDPPSWA